MDNNNWLEEASEQELLNELNSTQDENLKGEIEAQLDYRKEKGE